MTVRNQYLGFTEIYKETAGISGKTAGMSGKQLELSGGILAV